MRAEAHSGSISPDNAVSTVDTETPPFRDNRRLDSAHTVNKYPYWGADQNVLE